MKLCQLFSLLARFGTLLLLLLRLTLLGGRGVGFPEDLLEGTDFRKVHFAFDPPWLPIAIQVFGPEMVGDQLICFGLERLKVDQMLQFGFLLRRFTRGAELNVRRFAIPDRNPDSSSMDPEIVLHSGSDDHLLDCRDALIDCRNQLEIRRTIGDDFNDKLLGRFLGSSLRIGEFQPITHRFRWRIADRVLC